MIDNLVLTTERLILRPYRREDAEAVFEVVGKREIAETTVSIPHPYPRGTVDWWINMTRTNFEKGAALEFGVFYKKKPACYIGNCGLVGISKLHKNAELSYFVSPDFWSWGYGTEACRKIVEFGFIQLGLERVSGRCMAENLASRRVMEKSGLKYEGLARHEVLKWGQFKDVAKYGMIRSDWMGMLQGQKDNRV